MADVHVVRNVRVPLSLDTNIRRVAEYEDRTISKTIQRLLQHAIDEYFKEKGQLILHDEEMRAQRFKDILEEADEIAEDLDT